MNLIPCLLCARQQCVTLSECATRAQHTTHTPYTQRSTNAHVPQTDARRRSHCQASETRCRAQRNALGMKVKHARVTVRFCNVMKCVCKRRAADANRLSVCACYVRFVDGTQMRSGGEMCRHSSQVNANVQNIQR